MYGYALDLCLRCVSALLWPSVCMETVLCQHLEGAEREEVGAANGWISSLLDIM